MTSLTSASDRSISRSEIRDLTLWMVTLPALAFWPFTSAFPFFSLLSGTGSVGAALLQTALLLSGFWALLFAGLTVSFLKEIDP